MRLRWVGDARDYVKWDCVFGNAGGRFVFYLPMLRRTVDPRCRHRQVQDHFDRSKDLANFGALFEHRFEVFEFGGREYSKDVADEYFKIAIERVKQLQEREKLLVFIDPDTGLEPNSGGKDEHIRVKDLWAVWEALLPRSLLVLYQHASRTKGWEDRLATRARELLQLRNLPQTYCDPRLAGDVCFLLMEKPGP
jgi:hypothetical protein